MYNYYVAARDMSWKVLIKCGINSLPVDLNKIAEHYDIEIIRYSRCGFIQLFQPDAVIGDGFITKVNDKKTIFLNDSIKTRGRRRFTVGHELGHGILNHPLKNIITRNSEIDSLTDPLEMQANVFSRDTLTPACVLNAVGVKTVADIMKLCDLSQKSAEIRLERLELLRKRGAWFTSDLERQVFQQFNHYIEEEKEKLDKLGKG